MAIMSLMSLVPSVYKMFTGSDQKSQGMELAGELRKNPPIFNTPQQTIEATNAAKSLAMEGLPNLTKAENRLSSNTANSIYKASLAGSSPMDLMSVITGANANENNAVNDLLEKDAIIRQGNEKGLISQLNQEASFEPMKFEYNKYKPWMMDRETAANMISAGNQNMFGGLSESLGSLAMGLGNKGEGGLYDTIMGMFNKK